MFQSNWETNEYSIEDFYKHTNLEYDIIIEDDNGPVDFTGHTVEAIFMMKESIDDTDANIIIEKTSTVVDLSVGHIRLNFGTTDMDLAVEEETYAYEVALYVDGSESVTEVGRTKCLKRVKDV